MVASSCLVSMHRRRDITSGGADKFAVCPMMTSQTNNFRNIFLVTEEICAEQKYVVAELGSRLWESRRITQASMYPNTIWLKLIVLDAFFIKKKSNRYD